MSEHLVIMSPTYDNIPFRVPSNQSISMPDGVLEGVGVFWVTKCPEDVVMLVSDDTVYDLS